MIKYYVISPEVPGGIGEKSILEYNDGIVSRIVHLNFEFDDWLGDDVITTHPFLLVSLPLLATINENNLIGYKVRNVELSCSELFVELNNCNTVPIFKLLEIENVDTIEDLVNLQMDFYFYQNRDFVVSESVLNLIKLFNINNCEIKELKI